MFKLPEPYTSLFEAAYSDCGIETILEFVRKGADLNYCHPRSGHTALYTAARSSRARSVEALLKCGADPNQRFTYCSPVDGRVEAGRVALHYVSSPDVAKKLIEFGADISITDEIGITPLMRASHNGHKGVIVMLLEAGADPLARLSETAKRKPLTALELAESKVELWKEISNDARRLHYEEVCNILRKAEKEYIGGQ